MTAKNTPNAREAKGSTGADAADRKTYKLMADTAADRARMWEMCERILAKPTAEFVDDLRADAIAPQIRQATAWLGDEFEAKDVIGALGAFAAISERFTPEENLEQLTDQWNMYLNDGEVSEFVTVSARHARAEEDAWRRGDLEAAKDLRAGQFEAIDEKFQSLVAWSENADEKTTSLVVQVLVRVVAAHVTAESGRNLLGRLERKSGHLQFKFD